MTPFDFSEFPILETDRLILREPVLEDAPDVFISGSDPEVQKYNAKPMEDISEAVDFINELVKGYTEKYQIYWSVTMKGVNRHMGSFGYNYWSRNHNRGAIGYDLARAYWGQGYGQEAMYAILKFGFERMMLHRVEATTIADNHGSVNMLKRLGFTLEGLRREHSLEDDGLYHDGAIYGFLRSEFYNT